MRAYGAVEAGGVALWAMIETCAALFALDDIARAGAGLGALVVGTNDLAKEMRCRLSVERAALAGPLSLIVAAARAHGLVALDGVFNDIADADGLARQCAQGLEFGFDGKTLIHPSQVEPANAAFSPTPEEIAWSQAVTAAFDSPENTVKGVIKVDGRMVERLHLAQARRVLAVAQAIAAA